MVSSAGSYSVSGQQGSNWQLGVAVSSTATVTAPQNSATVYPTSVMTGTITGAVAGSTALLYLDGSTTPFAKANASTGSWSIPLTNVPNGAHTYSLSAGLGWSPGTPVTGSFVMAPVPATQSHIDGITGGVGGITLTGWAVWGDQPSAAVSLAAQVGANWTSIIANQVTTDSGLPSGVGSNHGFNATIPEAPGNYSVCLWTNNSGGGAATNLGCQSVTVLASPPTQSHIDSIAGGVASATVSGWAVWPDKLSTPVSLAVQVGASWTGMTANQVTADSGLPAGAGTSHGFSATIPLAPGGYSVCIWASSSVGGAATNLGCQSVTVLASPPTQSHIDSIAGGPGSVSFSGWAVWPDKLSSAVNLAVQIGASWTSFTANLPTTDTGLPAGAGTMHGFSGTIALSPGNYTVCVWAGTSTGGATDIGCNAVTVTAAG
jgi:hypothetical protein